MPAERWCFGLAFLLFLTGAGRDALDTWVGHTDMPVTIVATSPEVRDRHGALLRAYTVDEGLWRMKVSLDRVDRGFVEMLVAFEDKRFFDHTGVDLIAMMRALAQTLLHGRVVSGGSTLTMQVARLLEDGPTGQWHGKLRQIRVALALERRMEKDQILSLYLHLAPYGGNIEGVRAASLAWFGKEPMRLTPAQSALLVALPQSPAARRPDAFPARSRAARDRVLRRMAEARVIDAETLAISLSAPLPTERRALPQLAPHLADRAVAPGGGWHDLTLDADLQRRMQALARAHLAGRDPRLSVAMIVADHTSGEILGHLGSGDYTNSPSQGFVDMTRALRSPGSTLKPLVYGLGFDRGVIHPETLIADTPVRFGRYAPQNFDGRFRGEVRVRDALQLSLNIPVVRVLDRLGPAHLMAALRASGASPDLSGAPGLATALGGMGITLEDLVQLYAGIANGGEARALHWRPDNRSDTQRILSPSAAWHLGHILAGIAPPPMAGPVGHVAFKTGTSYGHRDAWAIGFDGRYVAGVWIGRPDGTPVPGAFGAEAAAPLLFRTLQLARPAAVPLPGPPADALLLSHAQLPTPLKRFDPAPPMPAIEVTFPPDGATLARSDFDVPVKLRGGTAPFTLMANGNVVATGLRRHEIAVKLRSPGYSDLTIIDANGQSSRVSVQLQ